MKSIYTWGAFERDARIISDWIRANRKQYNGVFGIPRGGLILATVLSHELDIPLLLGGVTEKSLVVDDIADTGNALRPYMERAKADVITLFRSKHCQINPTYYVADSENWIVFPWERIDVA